MRIRLLVACAGFLIVISACKKNVAYLQNGDKFLLSTHTHTEGSLTDVTVFKYDNQNHLIEAANDVQKYSYKYTYDSNDRVIETLLHSANKIFYPGQPLTYSDNKWTFDYSGNNGIVNVTQYFNGVVSSTDQYILNAKQQVVRDNWGSYGGVNYSVFVYDSDGNRISQTDHILSSGSAVVTFSYGYDKHKSAYANLKGNLVDMSQFTGSSLNNIVHYTYDYNYPPSHDIDDSVTSFEYNSDDLPVKGTTVKTTLKNVVTQATDVYSYVKI